MTINKLINICLLKCCNIFSNIFHHSLYVSCLALSSHKLGHVCIQQKHWTYNHISMITAPKPRITTINGINMFVNLKSNWRKYFCLNHYRNIKLHTSFTLTLFNIQETNRGVYICPSKLPKKMFVIQFCICGDIRMRGSREMALRW